MTARPKNDGYGMCARAMIRERSAIGDFGHTFSQATLVRDSGLSSQ
jgi:hypothetical protein